MEIRNGGKQLRLAMVVITNGMKEKRWAKVNALWLKW